MKSRHSPTYRRMLAALREAREAAGLTQTEAGKVFGGHASFVSKIESGERRLDVVELASFCRLYSVRLPAFLKSIGLD